FQAEDGIRDLIVTGVQTCALPIYILTSDARNRFNRFVDGGDPCLTIRHYFDEAHEDRAAITNCSSDYERSNVEVMEMDLRFGLRSEERRVGKEVRAGGWRDGGKRE